MKIIAFFDSDYNFSARLAKICDIDSNELIFLNGFNHLVQYKDKKSNTLIIIDIDDYKDSLDDAINDIKAHVDFPIYGLIDKMNIKIHKHATKIGFDIIMTKSMFLYNIRTIKKQLKNASRKS